MPMTRENKVALVVGFALVLLAGVLISDHFSKARLDRPTDLGVHQTAGGGMGTAMGELIDLSSYFHLPDDEPAAEVDLRARPPAEPPNTVAAEAPPAPIAPPPAAPVDPAEKSPGDISAAQLHEVQPGESLSVICQRYYHDQSLIDELARLNGIKNFDDLRAGARLRVPPAAELSVPRAGAPTPRPAPGPASAPAGSAPERTHTVKAGETLMQITARTLGSASRWRELVEANRDVIDDPDRIEAGMVLKLPAAKR